MLLNLTLNLITLISITCNVNLNIKSKAYGQLIISPTSGPPGTWISYKFIQLKDSTNDKNSTSGNQLLLPTIQFYCIFFDGNQQKLKSSYQSRCQVPKNAMTKYLKVFLVNRPSIITNQMNQHVIAGPSYFEITSYPIQSQIISNNPLLGTQNPIFGSNNPITNSNPIYNPVFDPSNFPTSNLSPNLITGPIVNPSNMIDGPIIIDPTFQNGPIMGNSFNPPLQQIPVVINDSTLNNLGNFEPNIDPLINQPIINNGIGMTPNIPTFPNIPFIPTIPISNPALQGIGGNIPIIPSTNPAIANGNIPIISNNPVITNGNNPILSTNNPSISNGNIPIIPNNSSGVTNGGVPILSGNNPGITGNIRKDEIENPNHIADSQSEEKPN